MKIRRESYIEKTAVIYKDKPFSFGSIYIKSDMIISLLTKYINVEEYNIGILMDNTPLFCSTVLAVKELKGSCILFSAKYKVNEINKYLKEIKPTIFIESGLLDIELLETEKRLIYSEEDDQFGKLKIWEFQYSKNNSADDKLEIDKDTFICQFTSGTTGNSKIVPRSYENIYHEIQKYSQTVPLEKSDVVICPSPLFHAYGLVNGFLVPFYNGITTILLDRFIPGEFVYYVGKYRATISICVPYMYHLLVETYVKDREILSSLRICFSAGGVMMQSTAKNFFKKYSLQINQQYGSTETGTICVNLKGMDGTIVDQSVGMSIEGTELAIMDEVGNFLDSGLIGEIAVKSPGTTKGYLNQTGTDDKRFVNGWYRTHDLGKLTSDGSLVLCGRASSFINVAGLKVDPVEVEQIISELDEVSECAVVGTKHEKHGEKVSAFIVLNSTISKHMIHSYCKERLADYKVPCEYIFLGALPKSQTGKILRKYLTDKNYV